MERERASEFLSACFGAARTRQFLIYTIYILNISERRVYCGLCCGIIIYTIISVSINVNKRRKRKYRFPFDVVVR